MKRTRAAKARKPNLIGKPVLVEWGDAWASDMLGFTTPEDAVQNAPIPVRQVGFCMSYTSEGLTLVREIHGLQDGENYRGEFFVPSYNIVRVKELR